MKTLQRILTWMRLILMIGYYTKDKQTGVMILQETHVILLPIMSKADIAAARFKGSAEVIDKLFDPKLEVYSFIDRWIGEHETI